VKDPIPAPRSTDHHARFVELGLGSVVADRYVARRAIARGGMCVVHEAEHRVTKARVALKTLTLEALGSPAIHERLLREARILGSLRHPNVVQIHDAGSCPSHGPFLALEMIEGRPVDGLLAVRGQLPVDQAVALVAQLCDALHDAHRRGVVHRDVKPANILISRTPIGDQVELIDFGVASEVQSEHKLTRHGELLGTVEYMAPEQLLGTSVDARTDVYAAGVLLHECLVGTVPFGGPSTTVIARLLSGQRPPPIARPDVPAALADAVARAILPDARDRFPTARDFAFACLDALAEPPRLALLEAQPGTTSLHDEYVARRAAAPEPDVASRRRHVRAPYVTPVRVFVGDRHVDGRTEDISEGGLLVVTDGEVPHDAEVRVRVTLPTLGKVVLLPATTRWVRSHRSTRALGLAFTELSGDVREDIRSYMKIVGTEREARDEPRERDVGRGGHPPAARDVPAPLVREHREVGRDRTEHPADRGQERVDGFAERVQRAAGQQALDDLLGGQAEEERHEEVVDHEVQREPEELRVHDLVVGVGRDVGEHEGREDPTEERQGELLHALDEGVHTVEIGRNARFLEHEGDDSTRDRERADDVLRVARRASRDLHVDDAAAHELKELRVEAVGAVLARALVEDLRQRAKAGGLPDALAHHPEGAQHLGDQHTLALATTHREELLGDDRDEGGRDAIARDGAEVARVGVDDALDGL
jgi:tRNA A-37 threonylcarbamoyl transferase component Bud32